MRNEDRAKADVMHSFMVSKKLFARRVFCLTDMNIYEKIGVTLNDETYVLGGCSVGHTQDPPRAEFKEFFSRKISGPDEQLPNTDTFHHSESYYYMRQRVTAIIIKDKKLLLIQEGGYCYTPGGGVEEGETHEEAIARECREEIGVSVLATRPYFTYDCVTVQQKTPQRNYCFFVDIEGVPSASDEDIVEDVFWLTYDELCARTDIILYEQEMLYDRLHAEGLI